MYNSRDYVSVPINDPKARGLKKQSSMQRIWNRASRCQRNFVVLILFMLTVSFIVYLTTAESAEEEFAPRNWRQKKIDISNHNVNDIKFEKGEMEVRGQLAQLDDIKKKAIQELEEKIAREMPKPVVVKKGPPQGSKKIKDMNLHPVDLDKEEKRENDAAKPIKMPDPKVEKPVHITPYSQHTKDQEKIVNMFKHAWKGYKAKAWGHDHLHPISGKYDDWFHVGLTMLDSLDTLYLMDMTEEYIEARNYVAEHVSFDIDFDVNLFECTIRVLGSMLSMYHLTHDRMYLDKAIDIGNRLLPAVTKSPSGVPYSDVNLKTGKVHPPRWGPDSTVSEITTIQLEFRDLSSLTGDKKYKDAVDAVTQHVHNLPGKKDGLVPMWINANSGQFRPSSTFTLGARADSYYEYLLKMWVQTDMTEDMYLNEYISAVNGIRKHLVGKSVPSGYTYIGELLGGKTPNAKMDHLVCFFGGTLALGSTLLSDKQRAKDDMELGKNLTETCYQMYAKTPTKLSPEITYFNLQKNVKEDLIIKPLDRHNLLRPETVESFFYMWRILKDTKYRKWGMEVADAFEKYSKVDGGYTSIKNVMDPHNTMPMDKMESFFLGETLKYLFLLFSDDDKLLPLHDWVFNTEAHPLPIQKKS